MGLSRRRKKAVRRRRRRRKKEPSTLMIVALWVKEVFKRIGLVVIQPFKAFREIVEIPDIGGPVIVLATITAMDLANRYLFYTYKIDLYLVKGPDNFQLLPNPPPMDVYTIYMLVITYLVSTGYTVLKNTVLYFVSIWAFKGNKSFFSLLAAIVYSMSVYIVGRLVESIFNLYLAPSIKLYMTPREDILTFSSSLTFLLLNRDNEALAAALSQQSRAQWEALLPSKVMMYLAFGFNVWVYLLGILIVYYASGLPRGKALVAGATPIVFDIVVRLAFTGRAF